MNLCECGCGRHASMGKRYIQHHQPNQYGKRPLTERFWAKVNKDGPIVRPELGPCWLWTGAVVGNYGYFGIEGQSRYAHRVAWFLETGKWPYPQALHKCDIGLCVRFLHLFEGTAQDNMDDMNAKGRHFCTMTLERAQEIRKRYKVGYIKQADLAIEFGTTQGSISAILLNKRWKGAQKHETKVLL